MEIGFAKWLAVRFLQLLQIMKKSGAALSHSPKTGGAPTALRSFSIHIFSLPPDSFKAVCVYSKQKPTRQRADRKADLVVGVEQDTTMRDGLRGQSSHQALEPRRIRSGITDFDTGQADRSSRPARRWSDAGDRLVEGRRCRP